MSLTLTTLRRALRVEIIVLGVGWLASSCDPSPALCPSFPKSR